MARELEDTEKEFNKYIKVFDNYTTFSDYDFDKNEKVKQMLNYYIEATTKPKEETLSYVIKITEILETMDLGINTKYKGKLLHGRFMMEKFYICDISTAISIWDGAYLGQGYNELIYIDTHHREEEKTKDDKNTKAMARSKAKNKK